MGLTLFFKGVGEMSRWTDQSKSHPFRASWGALKSSLGEVALREQASDQEFAELARLRKVVSYMDSVLDATDPELIPLTKWDELNPQVVACSNEVITYSGSGDLANLQQANAYADSFLVAVKPFVVASGRSARALGEAAREYSDTLTKFFGIYKKNAEEALGVVRESRDKVVTDGGVSAEALAEIMAARGEVLGEEGGEPGILQRLRAHLDDAEDSHEKISDLYNELLIGNEGEDSKKSKVDASVAAISGESERVTVLVNKTAELVRGIEAFYDKALGVIDENDGARKGGYAADLADLKRRLLDFEAQQNVKYGALNGQIESLLPGATSAGLASAYREMKDSFARPIRFAGGAFYVAIAVLIIGSVVMAIDSATWQEGVRFKELGDWQSVLRSLAYKLPFYGPAVWVAYYASKRRSEYQRLQQEYAHKEALAKSYDSYKKQIRELNLEDDEMLISLLNKAIDAIAHNASQTLDGKHGDKMPLQEAVDRLASALAKKAGVNQAE